MASWDDIDWDEKIEDDKKSQQKQETTTIKFEETPIAKFSDDDGNYFNENQERMKLKQNQKPHTSSKNSKAKDEVYLQQYSSKDLIRIRNYARNYSSKFHVLIYETFGQLERFILTHQQDLTNEAVVDLLEIDVALLQIPFNSHNNLLLEKIAGIPSFWSQVIEFLKDFMERKQKDIKFMLVVDMNGFFKNLELLIHSLLINNQFKRELEVFLQNVLKLMESYEDSKWNNANRLRTLQEDYLKNAAVFKIYDIYPNLQSLTNNKASLTSNITEGEYEDVSHYLQVQLPLLKEDFISQLPDVSSQLKSFNAWIHPKVRIVSVTRNLWNIRCPLIVVKLKLDDLSGRFFNGQMLCFTSSTDLTDLVVAVILKRDEQINEVIIEIIKTENIRDIFDKDLIMIEPVTFFEPYHRVFNVMRSLNELNFPFKKQILKLQNSEEFPDYQHADYFTYKEFSFKVENLNEWPDCHQLSLENMQLKAIQNAITSQFSIIQGPPGSGKTFVGLEILKILFENTKETILILTQTNSALDKFLIGASKFTESIARLGAQSKSEELDKFIFKPDTPLESKKYIKKLQDQHKEELEILMKANEKDEDGHKKVSTLYRLIDEINQLSLFNIISKKRIIGMTTTFAARNVSINKMLKPGIVIIEEASEVLESHVLVSLTKETKQLIMIGDHQQLRPLTSSFELVKDFDFNISLFERLIMNNFHFTKLDVQMRMTSDVCDLVRGTIYKDLRDGANVANYPKVKGMKTNFFCVNHSYPESVGTGGTSKENSYEVIYIVQLLNKLVANKNNPSQITILTVYAAQAQRIKKQLQDFPCNDYSKVRVAVIDAYQGEESDIILLSLVRSNQKKAIGFLANDNRVAVLLSRAKFGFYIVANMDCLAGASPIWKKIRKILKKKMQSEKKFLIVKSMFKIYFNFY